jgi:tyrosinase
MINRRTLLKTAATTGTVMVFAGTLPGLRAIAQAMPPLRRSLKGMDLDDPILKTWREFVKIMKDPSRDGQPVSWVSFSNIHGTSDEFNFCPHRNWYFLPWHRSYIRMYEVATRAVTGDMDFAMPYWDWTAQPDFPAALGDAIFDGHPNPLFVAGRELQTGDKMDESVVGQAVMDEIYANLNFEEFGSSRAPGQNNTDPSWIKAGGTQGTLEFNPHNNVHCDVLGPFMCSGASPQDPTFQMHHCNIDRIWAQWIAMGRSNSTDPLWLNMPFTNNFIDPSGNTYTDVVSELLEVEPLGYTYGLAPEPEPKPVEYPGRNLYLAALFGAPMAVTLESTGVERRIMRIDKTAAPGNPLSVTLQVNKTELQRAVNPSTARALEAAGLAQRKVYAFIRQMTPSKPHTTQLRIFVNLPNASATTPTTGNPNYVTSIGFFGPSQRHGDHDMGPSAAVNLTPALRRLSQNRPFDSDQITLQLVPAAQQGDNLAIAGDVAPATVELAIV